MKRLLLSWIGAFTVMFLLAGVFNGVVIRDFVASNIPAQLLRTPSDMRLILLGYAVLALLMAWVYPRTTQNPTILSGVVFGAVAGICWLLPYSLVLHGVYHFPAVALLIDPAWAVVEQGLGGLVIAVVHSRLR